MQFSGVAYLPFQTLFELLDGPIDHVPVQEESLQTFVSQSVVVRVVRVLGTRYEGDGILKRAGRGPTKQGELSQPMGRDTVFQDLGDIGKQLATLLE